MHIQAVTAFVAATLIAIGLFTGTPHTVASAQATAPRPAPIRTIIGATVPMPDFFGSMLTTR